MESDDMAEKKETKIEPVDIETVQKQIEKMLQEAQEQAERIVRQAQTIAKGEMSQEEKELRKKREDYWNEYVEVKLFKGSGKYADDVYVAVGDENCYIKRGERVKIKRKFAQLLDQSEMQDYETTKLIEKSMQPAHIADL